MRKIFICWILCAVPLVSQIEIVREEISGKKYRVVLRNIGYPYSIETVKNQRTILFPSVGDNGDGRSYKLPSRELFIALPAENRSPVSFVPKIVSAISDVIPERNKKIIRSNDSTFQLLAADESVVPQSNANYFKLNGYLWIGNNYCAHVSVFPYLFSPGDRQVTEVKEFSLEFEIPTVPESKNVQGASVVEPSIINPASAKRWQAAQPQFAVPQTDSWIDYSQEYLKIGVRLDAIYRLTYSDIVASGISAASINPKNFKIYLKGKQIPIYVSGEADNSFDPSDYIEFLGRRNYGDTRYREINAFGSSYYEYLNLYSDTTIYWLGWGGAPGTRIDTVTKYSGVPVDTTRFYDHLIHSESDVYWDFAQLGDGGVRRESPDLLENETWNHGTLGVGKFSASFSVANLFPNRQARAFAKVSDYSSSLQTNAHNLSLTIGAFTTTYDSGFINKHQVKTLQAVFQSSLLVNGNNTVGINSYAVAGNSVNLIARDWYELEYPRYLRTTTDSLLFSYSSLSAPQLSVVTLSGITTSAISIFRFSLDDSSVVKITNFTKSNDTIRFIDTVKNRATYFLNRQNKIGKPIIFYKKTFANLRSSTNKADYIAITHPYFLSAAAPYVSFIASSYGVTAKLVDLNDIYDEFNYGFLSPHPIRDFLASTHSLWQTPKPKYVLLIGKGTYDFYGNKTKFLGVPKVVNYVPSIGNPVSDSRFIIWDSTGANLPQMAIGRIPSKSISEFQSYFLKHQKYLTKGYDDWNKQYTFFSGGNYTGNEIIQTKEANDFIVNNYIVPRPIGGKVDHFYKTSNPITNFGPYSGEYVKSVIDAGAIYINYIGHSGTETWDNSITSISQLANIRDRNPLISDFGCSTAKHAEPDVTSFSEQFVVNSNGQAIAYIGNSSLGYLEPAKQFPKIFGRLLLVDTSLSIGETHRLAKLEFIGGDGGSSDSYKLFVQTNSIIGDPIVQLPIPPKPNLSFDDAPIIVSPERPSEQNDSVSVKLGYFNLGKVTTDSVTISAKVEYSGSLVYYKRFKYAVPRVSDSIEVKVPIRFKAGEYLFSFILDSGNVIDEIYETDNTFSYQLVVANTSVRPVLLEMSSRQSDGNFLFLNPTQTSGSTLFNLEIDLSGSFSSPQTFPVAFDTFFTKFSLPGSYAGKRIWMRTKDPISNSTGLVNSFFIGNKHGYLRNDSASFAGLNFDRTKHSGNFIQIDTTRIHFRTFSGGAFTGPNGTSSTALIEKNGINLVPENILSGFHVTLFDNVSFDFVNYYRFNIANVAADTTKFRIFLDTVATNYIVAMAIANNGGGGNLTTALKSRIKQFGSLYIDNVSTGHSWTMIGRKGATQGSVPEQYRGSNQGNAIAETTIVIPNNEGSFTTEKIGPVARWKSVDVKYSVPSGSSILMKIVGVSSSGGEDTLQQNIIADTLMDISSIDPVQYPSLKIVGILKSGSNAVSPLLSSLGVNFQLLPELGTNYQAFYPRRLTGGVPAGAVNVNDTIVQGEKIHVSFRVYNVGGVTAKNVPVSLSSLWENNYVEQLVTQTIDSIPPESYRLVTAEYNTSLGSGKRTFFVNIDADTTIRETYKDNNFFSFPFLVKKSPGNPLLPNLFISSNAITSVPAQITDETDTARFRIIYGNSGSLVNDSISIQVQHHFQGSVVGTTIVRRKYPVSYDTLTIAFPIHENAGEHQVSVDLDYNGLIVEMSESDNTANYYFTVATTDFEPLFPLPHGIASVDRIVFLNPTITAPGGETIRLELDTLSNFASPQVLLQQSKLLTTTFMLPGLKKQKRYHWRVKIQGSTRDWTIGSFFSGDSSSTKFGSSDSASWAQYSFTNSSYSPDSGAKIVDTKIVLKASSAGFNAGNIGSIEINGVNVIPSILGSGHNVVVVDTVNYSVSKQRRFDLAADANEADSLVQFIASVANGSIVVDVIVDDGANNLTVAARNALKSIGSALIDQVTFRDSWAIIGRKGASAGSVPEMYKAQNSGVAQVETTIIRKESSGVIATPLIGPFTVLSDLQLDQTIPSGSQIITYFVGVSGTNSLDTLITSVNQNNIPLGSVNTKQYQNGKLVFRFSAVPSVAKVRRSVSAAVSPVLKKWTMSAFASTELALSNLTSTIDRNAVMEGENINFSGRIYNVSTVAAESITVQLRTTASGIDNIVSQQLIPVIAAGDSANFSAAFNTRGKRGNHAFTLVIDPQDSIAEQSKSNNSVTIPFIVQSDTIRPTLEMTFDGVQIVEGDFVAQHPEVRIRFTDNNPSHIAASDTSNFTIRLNERQVAFTDGSAELLASATPGRSDIRWTPQLSGGENKIQIFAKDISGNYSDTTTVYVNVAADLVIKDIYNIPNPFHNTTVLTFNIAGPTNPEEVIVKIYTVAGRLIHEIRTSGTIGFNKIQWDGRDKDGDVIGNGVYLYKVIVKEGTKQVEGLSKLVKMR